MSQTYEHGHHAFRENQSCRCIKCIKKREMVEKMVNTMSYIPYGWLEIVRDSQNDYFSLPMWGTVWVAGDNKGCFEDLMKEYDLENEKDEEKLIEDEGEECATLIFDGWRELGDSGVFAREFDDELLIGIHGAGYNFYDAHWEPLYDAVGYRWHEC